MKNIIIFIFVTLSLILLTIVLSDSKSKFPSIDSSSYEDCILKYIPQTKSNAASVRVKEACKEIVKYDDLSLREPFACVIENVIKTNNDAAAIAIAETCNKN